MPSCQGLQFPVGTGDLGTPGTLAHLGTVRSEVVVGCGCASVAGVPVAKLACTVTSELRLPRSNLVSFFALSFLLAACSSTAESPEELPPGIADPWAEVESEDLHFTPRHIDMLARFAEEPEDRTVIATCVTRNDRPVHDVDANGRLWVGGGGESRALARIALDGTESAVPVSHPIDLLRALPDGRLVYASEGGLFQVDGGGRTEPIRFEVSGSPRPIAFCGDPSSDAGAGYVFAEMEGGGIRIFRRRLGRWLRIGGAFETTPAGLDWLARFQGACGLADDRLWFAQDDELWTLKPSELRGGMLPELVGASSLAADPHYGVVLAVRGTARLGPGEWTELAISANVRWVAAGDAELWVFTDDGVYYANAEGLRRYAIPNLPTAEVPGIYPFAGGFWWVAEDEMCSVLADDAPAEVEGVEPYARLVGDEVLRLEAAADVTVIVDDASQTLTPSGDWHELALGDLDFGWHRVEIASESGRDRQLYVRRERDDVLWETDIAPIATRSCALSGECHSGATERPNFATLDDWRMAPGALRERLLVQRDMPPAEGGYPPLAASELQTIQRWLQAGCPSGEDEGSCATE